MDCSSDLNGGVITLTALEMSDRVIRLMGASGKAWLYFNANLSIISDSRFNLDNHICVLSDINTAEPSEIYEKSYENIAYRLYHDDKMYMAYLEGRLLKDTSSAYEDTVKRIISENICEDIKVKDKKHKKKAGIKIGQFDGNREAKKKKKGIFVRKEEDSDGRYDE